MNQHVGFLNRDFVSVVRVNFPESDELWDPVGMVLWKKQKDSGLGEFTIMLPCARLCEQSTGLPQAEKKYSNHFTVE